MRKRRKPPARNVRVSGLVHRVDQDSGSVRMALCWAYKNATTRYVREPVTCVQCLAVQLLMGSGDDAWDVRRRLGEQIGGLWAPRGPR